jgi:hypothetical protein
VIVVQVSLLRTGGFTGLPLTSSIDTDELPEPERAAVLTALDDLAAAPPVIPPGAGGQPRYRLTFAPEADRDVLEIVESQIPAGLRPLIRELVQKAQPSR